MAVLIPAVPHACTQTRFPILVGDLGRGLDLVEQELGLLHPLTGSHDTAGDHELDLVGPVLELLADRLPHLS